MADDPSLVMMKKFALHAGVGAVCAGAVVAADSANPVAVMDASIYLGVLGMCWVVLLVLSVFCFRRALVPTLMQVRVGTALVLVLMADRPSANVVDYADSGSPAGPLLILLCLGVIMVGVVIGAVASAVGRL